MVKINFYLNTIFFLKIYYINKNSNLKYLKINFKYIILLYKYIIFINNINIIIPNKKNKFKFIIFF